jgi:hypothetical protein
VSERDEAKVGLKMMGTMKIGMSFYTGVTRLHERASQLAGDSAKVYEAWWWVFILVDGDDGYG